MTDNMQKEPCNLEPLHFALDKVRCGKTLSSEEIASAWQIIMSGHAPDGLVGGLLTMLASRIPSGEELFGASSIMREFVDRLDVCGDHTTFLDTCGTGGAPKTFNVSTAAGIVLAACGVKIAKHGNRSRTGRGSAEVLEALGVNIHATKTQQQASFEQENICFCFAPNHHKAVANVMPVRKQLRFPTIFNLLGPLSNPCGAGRQLLGVWDDAFVLPMAEALQRGSTTKSAVVHSADGLDEVSIATTTRVAYVHRGEITESVIDPIEIGLDYCPLDEVTANDLEQATEFVQDTLTGSLRNGVRGMTVINAALGLFLADRASDLSEGVQIATETIDSGRAAQTLTNWRKLSVQS
ncbi:MAG: anthranilate phosphoribosyltransferase [Phycisphaerales bacterium]|nr:anthranilate phosphoribosyltransferase [Phycisphaerales bacterium]